MIPLLDKTIVKISLISALILAFIAFYTWYHDQIFQAGVNSVHAELANEYREREQLLATKLSEINAQNEHNKQQAINTQARLNEAAAANRRLRDEINNAKFDCVDIGGDFMELWNKTISKPGF